MGCVLCARGGGIGEVGRWWRRLDERLDEAKWWKLDVSIDPENGEIYP